MTDNKAILNTLSDMLDAVIDRQLKKKGTTVCAKELTRVRGVINYANRRAPSKTAERLFFKHEQVLKDVYDTLRVVTKAIANEGKTLDNELRGVQNFSAYELTRIEAFAYKNILAKVLQDMLSKIPSEQAGTLAARFSVPAIKPTRGNRD